MLFQVIRSIAQRPGLLIDYQQMANDLRISNKTVSSYLHYLEEAFLIKKVYNFSKNRLTSEKKLKKFYLASPSFCWALSEFVDTGRLVKNYVSSQKGYPFFWRDPYHHEVDFIEIDQSNQVIPVEIKYKENLDKKELKNIILFSNKFKCKKAIVFTRCLESKTTSYDAHDVEIFKEPLRKTDSIVV